MCNGNGKIESSLQLIDKIENKVSEHTKNIKSEIRIATHPFVASYLNKKDGWFSSSICKKWSKIQ